MVKASSWRTAAVTPTSTDGFEKSRYRNGFTSASVQGPPKLSSTTPVLGRRDAVWYLTACRRRISDFRTRSDSDSSVGASASSILTFVEPVIVGFLFKPATRNPHSDRPAEELRAGVLAREPRVEGHADVSQERSSGFGDRAPAGRQFNQPVEAHLLELFVHGVEMRHVQVGRAPVGREARHQIQDVAAQDEVFHVEDVTAQDGKLAAADAGRILFDHLLVLREGVPGVADRGDAEADGLDRLLDARAGLEGKAVDEVVVDARESGGACFFCHDTHLPFGLHAVDGALDDLVEILYAKTQASEAEARERLKVLARRHARV